MDSAAFASVALTGHRDLADASHVTAELGYVARKLRREYGTRAAISGMALGADLLWAEAALAEGLELHAYVPFREQADSWPRPEKDRWRRLLDAAADVTTVGQLNERASNRAQLLHARNDAMVRSCDLLIAVLDLGASSRRGGSWATVVKEERWNGRRRPLLLIDASGAAATRLLQPGYTLAGPDRDTSGEKRRSS